MAEFINTIDVLGDDAVIDSIINGTITEFHDDQLEIIGRSAFQYCVSLASIKLPNVKTIDDSGFADCTSLEAIDLPSVTQLKDGAFARCTNVRYVNVPALEKAVTCFQRCEKVEKLVFPNLIDARGSIFDFCYALKIVDLHKAENAFVGQYVSSLKAIIIRTPTVCAHPSGYMEGNVPFVNGTCFIYVPRDLVESYKVATNWSKYPNQFRALEDYTVDGTTTGAFDESKI